MELYRQQYFYQKYYYLEENMTTNILNNCNLKQNEEFKILNMNFMIVI